MNAMIGLQAETDIHATAIPASGTRDQFFMPRKYGTSGGNPFEDFFVRNDGARIIEPALNIVQQNSDRVIKEAAKRLLGNIHNLVVRLQDAGTDFSRLPALNAFNPEDGSVLIEWTFPDYRIGFTFEQEEQESGWYLVSNVNLGQINASGYLSTVDNKMLLLWLLGFILGFS